MCDQNAPCNGGAAIRTAAPLFGKVLGVADRGQAYPIAAAGMP